MSTRVNKLSLFHGQWPGILIILSLFNSLKYLLERPFVVSPGQAGCSGRHRFGSTCSSAKAGVPSGTRHLSLKSETQITILYKLFNVLCMPGLHPDAHSPYKENNWNPKVISPRGNGPERAGQCKWAARSAFARFRLPNGFPVNFHLTCLFAVYGILFSFWELLKRQELRADLFVMGEMMRLNSGVSHINGSFGFPQRPPHVCHLVDVEKWQRLEMRSSA